LSEEEVVDRGDRLVGQGDLEVRDAVAVDIAGEDDAGGAAIIAKLARGASYMPVSD